MRPGEFRVVKPEIRVVGIDDGFFLPHTTGKCKIVGVVFRGGYWLDGIMHTWIEIDGMDATEKIGEMIEKSPHFGQLRVIMLDGVTFAGFNVVDTLQLFEMTRLPVIAITRELPDLKSIQKALKNLEHGTSRLKAMRNLNNIAKVFTRKEERAIYMQVTGLELNLAKNIVQNTSTRSNIPEPLRVAHLIASGLTTPT
ncbi:MAG: DUF99 family protein [Candidatus Bathyarchaeota archaeon]|nr:DUF99 family protein [Candidatus Bathyarchaeota archaeon]